MKCDLCGREMNIRKGKYGDFWGCSGYPECKGIVKISSNKPQYQPKPSSSVVDNTTIDQAIKLYSTTEVSEAKLQRCIDMVKKLKSGGNLNEDYEESPF